MIKFLIQNASIHMNLFCKLKNNIIMKSSSISNTLYGLLNLLSCELTRTFMSKDYILLIVVNWMFIDVVHLFCFRYSWKSFWVGWMKYLHDYRWNHWAFLYLKANPSLLFPLYCPFLWKTGITSIPAWSGTLSLRALLYSRIKHTLTLAHFSVPNWRLPPVLCMHLCR